MVPIRGDKTKARMDSSAAHIICICHDLTAGSEIVDHHCSISAAQDPTGGRGGMIPDGVLTSRPPVALEANVCNRLRTDTSTAGGMTLLSRIYRFSLNDSSCDGVNTNCVCNTVNPNVTSC